MAMRTSLLRALSLLDAVSATPDPAPLDPRPLVGKPAPGKHEPAKQDPDKSVQGLRLTLDRAAAGVLEVTFQNVAVAPMMLTLGVMLGNGRALIPDQLYLIVTPASGEPRRLAWKGFRVNGRMDDFLVPLMPGTKYSLTLSLDNFVEHGRKSAVVAGDRVRVVYLGAAPSHGKHATQSNLPIWDGKVDTATLQYKG
jgi:hypothetical protein